MSSENRRRYFRIEDEIIFRWHVITSEELLSGVKALEHQEEKGYYDEMEHTEARIASLLSHLKAKNPDLATAIELVNHRVDLYVQHFQFERSMQHAEWSGCKPQWVEISASGMSFKVNESPPQLGAQVEVELYLLPTYEYIRTFGTVASIVPLENERFLIAVNFDVILREDKERLIQHALKRQAHALRVQRAQKKKEASSSQAEEGASSEEPVQNNGGNDGKAAEEAEPPTSENATEAQENPKTESH